MSDDFDALMEAEFPHGMHVDEADIKLRPEQRATVYLLDGLTQVCHQFHCYAEVIPAVEGLPEEFFSHPGGPTAWMREKAQEAGSFMPVLDLLTEWEESKLANRFGFALQAWMLAHNLGPHIHCWVNVPVAGWMPLRIQEGDMAVILPIPREAVED